LPVLWQVRSADYSHRAKRDDAWDLLMQFTREKIPDADLCFVKKKVDSIITAAATCFDELILDTEMYAQSWESAHACMVKYIRARLPSQARRAGVTSVTRTCMGLLRVSQAKNQHEVGSKHPAFTGMHGVLSHDRQLF
jgi:CDP-glycerol glycerophosphotransferase (TagB/SpsB family)